MHAQVEDVVAGLRSDPPPLDDGGGAPGRRAARVARRRALHLPRLQGVQARASAATTSTSWRRPGPGSASCAPTRRCRRRSAGCPDAAKAKAREKTLLVLAKANSRATVHRPAYLDYVGVKTFDENGEVDGERRFLGLFSSAAYTESLMRIPLIREKAAAVLKRSGFDPRSHAGKALMDTLETYPRDELFHTPVDELAPMAEAAMAAGERRAVRMLIRRDTYGRYVSVIVYLPRDRYNTAVRERFARILQERLNGESTEFTVRINESTTARVHFVVHLPKGDDDPGRRHRRPRAAAHRGVPLLARRLPDRGDRGVRRGGRHDPRPPLRRLVPGGATRRTSPPAPPRSTSAGSSRSTGEEGVGLSLYEQLDAGRGEARLKVYRIGVAALAVRAAADAVLDGRRGRRRAALRARGPGAVVDHLRVRAAVRREPAVRHPRAVPGRAARDLGRRQRDRRLQRAGPRRRA